MKNHEKITWEREIERENKKKRISEYAKTISRNPIKEFKHEPFHLNKKKFGELPTIRCKSCSQIFHCDWKDRQLVVHEEQELMTNKDWKGFEKIRN
jgi:primosomal protein N'